MLITDDEVACAKFPTKKSSAVTTQATRLRGIGTLEAAQRGKYIMEESGLSPQDRPVVKPLLKRKLKPKAPASLQLPNGKIITGKQSDTMTASAASPTQLH